MRCASRAANGPDHLGLCRRVLLDSYMKKAFENNDVFSSDRFRRFLKPGGEEGDGGLGVGCEGALVFLLCFRCLPSPRALLLQGHSAVLPLPSVSETVPHRAVPPSRYKHSGYLGVTRANQKTYRAKIDRTTAVRMWVCVVSLCSRRRRHRRFYPVSFRLLPVPFVSVRRQHRRCCVFCPARPTRAVTGR